MNKLINTYPSSSFTLPFTGTSIGKDVGDATGLQGLLPGLGSKPGGGGSGGIGGLKGFMSGSGGNLIGSIANIGTSILGGSAQANAAGGIGGIIGSVGGGLVKGLQSSGVMNMSNLSSGPWGAVANVGTAALSKILGKNMNYDDKAGKIMSGVTGVVKNLGPIGLIAGTALDLANMIGSKTYEGTTTDTLAVQETGGGYNTSNYELGDMNISGIGRLTGADDKFIRKRREMQRKLDMIADIGTQARNDRLRAQGSVYSISNRNNMDMQGGFRAFSVKKGGKLYDHEFILSVLRNSQKREAEKGQEKNNIPIGKQRFKKGGKFGCIIPDGKLHKELHHLDFGNNEVSRKGIPVVTTNKKGEVKQQAEIERDEIIFNLALTQKLESLMKSGTDDDMVKAGEILWDAILNNSKDNSNLIKRVRA